MDYIRLGYSGWGLIFVFSFKNESKERKFCKMIAGKMGNNDEIKCTKIGLLLKNKYFHHKICPLYYGTLSAIIYPWLYFPHFIVVQPYCLITCSYSLVVLYMIMFSIVFQVSSQLWHSLMWDFIILIILVHVGQVVLKVCITISFRKNFLTTNRM